MATTPSSLLLFTKGRMRCHVSLEDVDKHELEKQIKGTLGPWNKRELKVKYKAVPQSDPTSLSLNLN